ncbi:MAG: nucleotide exchange factor GrpE, partial [Planctomycetota bacterium]
MSDQVQPEPLPNSPEPEQPASELETLQLQLVEWKERCVRQQAEFENVRKRLRKEVDEAGSRAVARFVRPLLDQFDNLDRALAAASPESFAEFAKGVTMIRESRS